MTFLRQFQGKKCRICGSTENRFPVNGHQRDAEVCYPCKWKAEQVKINGGLDISELMRGWR